jgi:LuxR family maltose regulon positive regulatory protein
LVAYSYAGLGEVLREEGRWEEALGVYQELLHFAEDREGRPDGPLTGSAHTSIGVIYREWHDLDRGLEEIAQGVHLCREWQQGEALAVGLLELSETHRIRGEYAQAQAALNEVKQVAAAISPWATGLVESFAARLALSQGEVEAAVQWAARSGLEEGAGCEIGYERFPECLPLMRTFIESGDPRRAEALAARLVEQNGACGRMGRVLDLLVLQAAAWDALGQPQKALEVLGEAVDAAAPQKRVRPFVEEGQKWVPYLAELAPSPHRDRLLAILRGERAQPAAPARETPTSEPFNDRELSILRLMSAGLSNREIAEELYLSVNTIRWYASQIYRKLDVKRRGEAVARAREIGAL